MDIGYLLDGTSVAQEPQDEQTDPSRLLCSLSSFRLGLVFTRDVVVAPHVALPVVARPHVNQRTPLLNRTHAKVPTSAGKAARVGASRMRRRSGAGTPAWHEKARYSPVVEIGTKFDGAVTCTASFHLLKVTKE